MLFKKNDGKYTPWNIGSSAYLPAYRKGGHNSLTVAVNCRLGNLPDRDVALLDTAADWSMIGGETLQLVSDQISAPVEPKTIHTRLGNVKGHLHRMTITLLADNGNGCDLDVECTVFVSAEWDGPIVLGYYGFLEKLCFALEPCLTPEEQCRIYFGICG